MSEKDFSDLDRLMSRLPPVDLPTDFTAQVMERVAQQPPPLPLLRRPLVQWLLVATAFALAAGRLALYILGVWMAVEAVG